MNGDGVDDFVIIDALIQNEDRLSPSADDIRRWAEGELPDYGINGWSSGDLDFPVISDGNRSVWQQWYPSSGSLPSNIVIGSDFVVDFFDAGWGGSMTDAIRCCIEKNLCEGLDPSFVIPSTGTSCDSAFDCQVYNGSFWEPVCRD